MRGHACWANLRRHHDFLADDSRTEGETRTKCERQRSRTSKNFLAASALSKRGHVCRANLRCTMTSYPTALNICEGNRAEAAAAWAFCSEDNLFNWEEMSPCFS